ncbi:MAG: DUF222 domain-containing protein [Acidimicrobiales bacterium]
MAITTMTDDSSWFPFGTLVAEARGAAATDVERLTDAEVLVSITELCEVASAVNVALAKVISHADRHDLTVQDCGLKVGAWMARNATRPAGQCRKQASKARHAIAHFADSVHAAADGPMGWDHVDLLVAVSNVRNRDALASVQDRLIEAAQQLRWREWETLVRTIAEEADEDGSYDPNEDEHANRLRLNALGDGTIDVSGRLVGETAHIVEGTIDAIADELFRNYKRDHDLNADIIIPDRTTLKALALAEACRRARAINLNQTAPARPETIVVIQHDPTSERTWITDRYGKVVPAAALDRLLDDADYRALNLDATGQPLDLGKKHRLISRDQRTALTVRDGGCIFPGCDTPAPWCDGHHVIAFIDGGPTDLYNIALLCRQHHGLTHSNGWRMRQSLDPTQHNGALFAWETPTGKTLHSEHRRTSPA